MGEFLKGRVALVTGASRGIGRAIALAMAREGAHVIGVARTTGGLEELDDEVKAAGGTASLVPLDLRKPEGLDQLGAVVFERWKKLDILVGNAGVLGRLSPLGHIEPKIWDEVMTVNVTANWRLIRAFDPLLRQSDGGRAVFVTSAAAYKLSAYWGPYSVSKAALEALVKTYAAETATTAIRVNLLNPGPVRTHMRAQAMPGEDPQTLPPARAVAEAFLPLAGKELKQSGEIFDFHDGRIHQREYG
ncbi:MAG TPA: SDR family NAD(P)-dependent oxidoreductase [Aestuariivirgaceae bacterium]|nr:SDR family NAD(P)-dependent oxidoreductase [Aestuariivirgaceae bacterium]